jgi:hypothetical protein
VSLLDRSVLVLATCRGRPCQLRHHGGNTRSHGRGEDMSEFGGRLDYDLQ